MTPEQPKRGMPDGGTTSLVPPTVLVIEDDVAIGDLVGELLSDEGAIVVRAGDGRSGLGLANDSRPDLILLDYRLPDGTGASVLQSLRQDEATRAIPVVMMSGSPRQLEALTPAPDALVAKPFDLDDLLCVVGRLVPLAEGPIR